MVNVTKVNLPERTRARFETESNQQRVQKPHDIRGAVPLVDYTNPAKFPPYLFREYPKMPLLDGNRPIVIDESGGVLVFYDAADEVEFKDLNPEIAEEIERNSPEKTMADTLSAQEEELSELRRMLMQAGIDPNAGKAKKKAGNALASMTRADTPEPEDDETEKAGVAMSGHPEPNDPDDLRSTLPSTKSNPLKKKH